MEGIRAVLALCRFVHDGAALALWGTFGYLLACVPARLGLETADRLGRLPLLAALAALISAIAILPVRTAMIGNGWPDALAPALLWKVVTATSVGTAWLVDVAMSVLLVLAVLTRPPHRAPAVTAFAGLTLASLVLTGHAMMHEHWLGTLQQVNDLVHVLASGAWVGALVPLTIILRGLSEETRHADHDTALRRFSLAGQAAVVLILVTGIANTLLIVGGWPLDWASLYQVLLCAKIAVVLVMIALASRNHLILVPCLGDDRHATALAIRRAAFAEAALGFTAIALVAVFGLLDPA